MHMAYLYGYKILSDKICVKGVCRCILDAMVGILAQFSRFWVICLIDFVFDKFHHWR